LFDKPSAADVEHDAWKFGGYPGVTYKAKDQCEILLRDKDSFAFVHGSMASICQNLHCRTPNESGFFFAGPALQGTECGSGKWCEGGSCVKKTKLTTTTERPKPSWSPWRPSACRSSCLEDSRGHQTNQRTCNDVDSDDDMTCDGHSYTISLCDDKKLCAKRKSIIDYGTEKCKAFSEKIPQLDPEAAGLQAPHDSLRLWMGCAVFCRHKASRSYYSPRFELNQLRINPYFPDGTLCHRQDNENFYCLQHHCLPEVS